MPSFAQRPSAAVIFPTCVADTVRPGLVTRARALLTRRGVDASVARNATCCGQPAYNAGYAPEARRVARASLRALARTMGPVIVPSGSCAAMMAHHWTDLFSGTRDETAARSVAARVVELSQALAEVEARPAPHNGRAPIAYHGSCHLERELHVRDEPRQLLSHAGYDVREPVGADRCCGFGGTFSVKMPAVSVAMADEKLNALSATGAVTVVGCDLSCLVHLESRARVRSMPLQFRHLAEVIDD